MPFLCFTLIALFFALDLLIKLWLKQHDRKYETKIQAFVEAQGGHILFIRSDPFHASFKVPIYVAYKVRYHDSQGQQRKALCKIKVPGRDFEDVSAAEFIWQEWQ